LILNSHYKFWPARFLPIALSIWLSGMSCLLCCGTALAAETAEIESCAAADECPIAASEAHGSAWVEDDCCPETSEHSESSPCHKGCRILDRPSSDLPAAQHLILPIVTSSPAWNLALPDAAGLSYITTGQYHSPNRRETYLRCCVFLI
jgi:hypothetical protein